MMIATVQTQLVSIIDIGMGNLRSVANAIDENGFDPIVIDNPTHMSGASHVILPGVGSYAVAAERLRLNGWVDALHAHVDAGRPLLGICLGMQLLGSSGSEGGDSFGINLIPGRVVRFDVGNLRVPHVGWNTVEIKRSHPVFSEVKTGCDFYFVHGYHFVPDRAQDVLSITDYGTPFCSTVASGSVIGTQFHPEKSQLNGLRLLESFLQWDGSDMRQGC